MRSRLRFGSTSRLLTVWSLKGGAGAADAWERRSRKASSMTLLTAVPRRSAYCLVFSRGGSEMATVVRTIRLFHFDAKVIIQ